MPATTIPSRVTHLPRISIVIATYRRERILLETIEHLVPQLEQGDELLIVDQTEQHERQTHVSLAQLHAQSAIRWIRHQPPSITAAMNRGVLESVGDIVLFVDDDIRPEPALLSTHRSAHAGSQKVIVAGRVIQPWEVDAIRLGQESRFAIDRPGWLDEFMGGNFSIERADAIEVGGFDENFVQVAYRFEAEFANRFRASGGRIWFEPNACLYHLRAPGGGTRSYGQHLTTSKPSHSVGAYYCFLRTQTPAASMRECLRRPARVVATRHHLRAPWWIPVTLFAEMRGLLWAMRLNAAGPKLIRSSTGFV